MRVADTSALYALFDEDDAHHERATAAVEQIEPIVAPTEILVETVDLVSYRLGRAAGRAALEDLLAIPHLRPAERVEFEAVARVCLAAKGTLSLADAVVVQTCRALAAPPLTFDRDILEACRG